LTGLAPELDGSAAAEPVEGVVDMVRSLDVGIIPRGE